MLNVRDGDRTIVYCYVILYFRKTLSCVPSHNAHKLLSSSLTSNVMPILLARMVIFMLQQPTAAFFYYNKGIRRSRF
jgi:hypothetical protein